MESGSRAGSAIDPELPPVTAGDESFSHQQVAPVAVTAHLDPAWAERCWHLLNVGDGWVLGLGRATWPHRGARTAVAGLGTNERQYSRRASEPFLIGEDPNQPNVGPIRIEAVEPLRTVRLVLDEPGFDLAFDLTYTARFDPVPTDRNRIERDGVVVTDYMNFFQPGSYSGVIAAGGEERQLQDRLGFRDRGWGLRKHEGSARRGMHIFCACELPDESIYMLIYETSSGRRVMTNGWLIRRARKVSRALEADHDLRFDGLRLLGGELTVRFADDEVREIIVEAEGRVWMETVGYTNVPGRGDPGADVFDLSDPAVRRELEGLFDSGCRFSCGGVDGYGFVETGLGVHAKYRPEAQ